MRPSTLAYLYVRRLRAHPASELFALVGIAAGVALVFAVQVANTSVTGSVERMAQGIAGSATLQLAARSPEGFDSRTAAGVRRLPAVDRAAPLLELRGGVRGPGGRQAVTFAGADLSLPGLGGLFLRELALPELQSLSGVALPTPMARRLGVGVGDHVQVQLDGRAVRARVIALLDHSEVGPLADSPVVPTALSYLQSVSGIGDRVTRILVAPKRGRQEAASEQLARFAANRANVGPSDTDVRLIRQASAPNTQSTALFAALSALVGFLFAFNAMLLTVPERRKFAAEVRMDGYDDRAVIQIVLFEGVALGLAASIVGLVLGDQLSRHLFETKPGYLSFAFAVGDQRVVTASAVALAVASGLGAALLATARPLSVLGRNGMAAPGREIEEAPSALFRRRSLVGASVVALFGAGLVYALAPSAAIVGIVLLVAGMLLAVPAILGASLTAIAAVTRGGRLPMLLVSLGELRSTAVRSCGLAATGALAVFGAVAVGGAHDDLVRGLDDSAQTFAATADIWVTTGGDENGHTTAMFDPPSRTLAALRADERVSSVRLFHAGSLDAEGRRLWIVARPGTERQFVAQSQLVEGDAQVVTRKLREPGWVAVSRVVADQFDVGIGDALDLPSATGPARFRVAGVTTNFGWSPGVVTLNARDYRRRWTTTAPTALEIDAAAGRVAEVKDAVERTVGGAPLTIETAGERAGRFKRLARQGLDRLSQISALMVIAAILALAAAIGGVLWQRRPRLAALKLSGFDELAVWRALLLEAAIVLGVGCSLGAAIGLSGQALLARALEVATGFPVHYEPAAALAVLALCGIGSIAALVTALPGFLAARVPPLLALQEE